MARRTIAAAPFSKTMKATPRLAYWFRCLSMKNGSTLTTSNLSGGIVIAETFWTMASSIPAQFRVCKSREWRCPKKKSGSRDETGPLELRSPRAAQPALFYQCDRNLSQVDHLHG